MKKRLAKLVSQWCLLSAVGIAILASNLSAQSEKDIADVEMAAIRALLASGDIPNTSVAISPLFDAPGAAPGRAIAGRMRPSARSVSVGRSLNARIAQMDEVLQSSVGGKNPELAKVQTVISLSEPEFSGDKASITVTALFKTGSSHRPFAYQTIEFKLIRREARWIISESSVLGVS